MAEFGGKLSAVLEIDPEKNRNAEHELPMRYRVQDIVADIFPELSHLFGVTARAKPTPLATERQEVFATATGIRAPDPGKSFEKVLFEPPS